MSSDKFESLSERWASRYDDRDDEALAHEIWSRQIAARERALAQPFKGLPIEPSGSASSPPNPDRPTAE